MDLLGGYDSEDSSYVSVTKAPPVVPVSSTAVAPAAAAATANPEAPAIATTDSCKASTTTKTVQNKNQQQQRKRGKKLLKLQSVLPQHIWNQLTASSATTAGTSSSLDQPDDDDDDDDEMDDPNVVHSNNFRRKKLSQSKPSVEAPLPKNASSQKGHSSSLLDLLNSLPTSTKQKQGTSSILATAAILPSSLMVPTTTATNDSPRPVPSSPSPQMASPFSGLGGAFLTSTVQVTRTKKGEQKIRSIHSPVDSDGNDDDKQEAVDSLKPGHSTARETSSHVSVLSQKESDQQVPPRGIPPALQAVPRPSLSYLAPSAEFSGRSATVRSTTRRRSAAPPVRANGLPSMATYPTTPFHQEEEEGTALQPLSQQNHLQHLPRAVVPLSNKARKKQMEAMLRAGNLDEIDSDIHLTGGGNANYATQALLQQQQQQATAQYQAHGVRVVPTSQYNPSTGQMDASASISGKQKGKNQLIALLANAASLEASRMENPQLSNNTRGTYRNNAKRKYGW